MRLYYWTTLFTLLATMALVVLGGVVHNTGASLACPDWPTCYGSLMPPMEGLVAIEHGHRMLATFVGLCSIVLLILSLRQQPRDTGLVLGSSAALILVIGQGILGGITVLYQLPDLVSTAHLGTSQIFAAVLLFLLMRSQRYLHPSNYATHPPYELSRNAGRLALFLFAQMLLGAFVRHSSSGAACGVGWESVFACNSTPVSWIGRQGPEYVHMLHRAIAILLGAALIYFLLPVMRWARQHGHFRLRSLCILCWVLWGAQAVLGLASVAHGLSIVPVTLHLLGAMLLWLCVMAVNFSLRNFKLNHILRA